MDEHACLSEVRAAEMAWQIVVHPSTPNMDRPW